jgi:hypothetical protein
MSDGVYTFLSKIGIRTHRSFRLTIRAVALVVGVCAGFAISVMIQESRYWSAGLVFVIVLLAGFIEFVIADVLADRSFPFDTERKLELMEGQLGQKGIAGVADKMRELIGQFRACDQSQVRATVHVFVPLMPTADQPARRGLLQLTDYVARAVPVDPGVTRRRKGRIIPVNQGIIGRCARTGAMETVGFADMGEYREAMVRDFGFTPEEAEKHTTSARSYLAFPLRAEEEVVGVLYFFTTEPQVFPRAADREQLESGARDIVRLLELVTFV